MSHNQYAQNSQQSQNSQHTHHAQRYAAPNNLSNIRYSILTNAMKQNSAYDGFLQRARILAVLKESNKKENENLENLINDQMRKLVVELDSFPVTLMQWRRYGQGGEV